MNLLGVTLEMSITAMHHNGLNMRSCGFLSTNFRLNNDLFYIRLLLVQH